MFFRWLMVIPSAIVLVFVGIAASVAVFIAWFAVLFTGQWPEGLRTFVLGYLRWIVRLSRLRLPPHRRVPAVLAGLTTVTPPGRSVRPTSSTSSSRSGCTCREPDRPAEPAGGELHPQQALDEPEVAAVGA